MTPAPTVHHAAHHDSAHHDFKLLDTTSACVDSTSSQFAKPIYEALKAQLPHAKITESAGCGVATLSPIQYECVSKSTGARPVYLYGTQNLDGHDLKPVQVGDATCTVRFFGGV